MGPRQPSGLHLPGNSVLRRAARFGVGFCPENCLLQTPGGLGFQGKALSQACPVRAVFTLVLGEQNLPDLRTVPCGLRRELQGRGELTPGGGFFVRSGGISNGPEDTEVLHWSRRQSRAPAANLTPGLCLSPFLTVKWTGAAGSLSREAILRSAGTASHTRSTGGAGGLVGRSSLRKVTWPVTFPWCYAAPPAVCERGGLGVRPSSPEHPPTAASTLRALSASPGQSAGRQARHQPPCPGGSALRCGGRAGWCGAGPATHLPGPQFPHPKC